MSDMLVTLATAIGGAVAAKYADRALPDLHVTVPGTTVRLPPGLLGSAAIAAALAMKFPLPAKAALAGLALGGIIVEGSDLAEQHLVPMLGPTPTGLPPGAGPAAGLPAYGYGAVGALDQTSYELGQALQAYQSAA